MSDIIEEFLAEFLAQDTMEDGFTTLHTKEGVPYIANLDPEEKARYSETKIPLSKIKKEEKAKKEQEKDPEFEKYVDSLKNTKIKGFFGRIKDMNKAILNDIEERGITTMEGVNQLLKEKYPGRLPSTKKPEPETKEPETKEPETKEPEKKEDDSKTIEGYLLKNGGKLWNDRRIYMKDIAKKLLKVDTEFYNSGRLQYFSWEDGQETNSYGRKILESIDSAYFDKNSQTFKCDSLDIKTDKIVAEKLNEKAKEMGLTVKEKPVITGNTVKDQIRRFVVDGWNGKIYKYKDGTKAIFSNNKKIVLTDEQFDYLKDKATN